jgi:hypothetical protein
MPSERRAKQMRRLMRLSETGRPENTERQRGKRRRLFRIPTLYSWSPEREAHARARLRRSRHSER